MNFEFSHGPKDTLRYCPAQYPKVVYLPVLITNNRTMSENVFEMRRDQALLAMIREKFCGGVTAELARRIGKDPSYVARLFYPATKNGAKGIGLEVMNACDAAFRLPAGFWSMDLGSAALELSGHAALYKTAGGLRSATTGSPGRNLAQELLALATPLRPTLRKNLGALITDLLESADDPAAVEMIIQDIERFYPS